MNVPHPSSFSWFELELFEAVVLAGGERNVWKTQGRMCTAHELSAGAVGCDVYVQLDPHVVAHPLPRPLYVTGPRIRTCEPVAARPRALGVPRKLDHRQGGCYPAHL